MVLKPNPTNLHLENATRPTDCLYMIIKQSQTPPPSFTNLPPSFYNTISLPTTTITITPTITTTKQPHTAPLPPTAARNRYVRITSGVSARGTTGSVQRP